MSKENINFSSPVHHKRPSFFNKIRDAFHDMKETIKTKSNNVKQKINKVFRKGSEDNFSSNM